MPNNNQINLKTTSKINREIPEVRNILRTILVINVLRIMTVILQIPLIILGFATHFLSFFFDWLSEKLFWIPNRADTYFIKLERYFAFKVESENEKRENK